MIGDLKKEENIDKNIEKKMKNLEYDLIKAINKGDLQIVKSLINEGVAVNPPTKKKDNYGFFISDNDDRDENSYLCSYDFGDRKLIPLEAAIKAKKSENKIEIVKALVDAGANVDLKIIEKMDFVGDHSSHSETLLQMVIYDTLRDPERNIEILSLFLKKGADPNKLRSSGHGSKRGCSSYKEAAIHAIADNREEKILKALLEGGAKTDVIYSESVYSRPSYNRESQKTPLHFVCQKNKLDKNTEENELIEKEKQYEMAKLLIQYGADVNKECPRVESIQINTECEKNEEKKYENNKVLEYPIHMAIFSENLKLVELLMNNGAKEFDRIYGEKTSTCLEIVDELIKKAESEKQKQNLENIRNVIQNKGK